MSDFEQLQNEKTERAGKLLQLLPQIAASEVAGRADLVQGDLRIVSKNLDFLLELIKKQKTLVLNEQCQALLDHEVIALENKHKELDQDVISHVKRASRGGSFNIVPVRSALMLIASRRHSLYLL